MRTAAGFRDTTADDIPVGTMVRVIAYGYGARKIDCGRTGTVTAHGRTRVTVSLSYGNGEPAGSITVRPLVLSPLPTDTTNGAARDAMTRPVRSDGLTRVTPGQDTFREWSVRRSQYVTPLMRVIMATRIVGNPTYSATREYVVGTHFLGADEWSNGTYTHDIATADRAFRSRVASWS